MGLYTLCLAGSNYIAPVICGFIAEYHGWQWVFYWPSIFIAVALVFLFFFLEETNYERRATATDTSAASSGSDHEKGSISAEISASTPVPDREVVYNKKTYMQKLSLLGPRQSRNNMLRRFRQVLYFLSWPVIFYAGLVFPGVRRSSPILTRQVLIRFISHLVQCPKRDIVYHPRIGPI